MPRTASNEGSSIPVCDPQHVATVSCAAERIGDRELDWLESTASLLEEAEDPSTPLLERVRSLAFLAAKLDDFFRVRMANLQRRTFDGLAAEKDVSTQHDPTAALVAVDRRVRELVARQNRCWSSQLRPALGEAGIHLLDECQLDVENRRAVEAYYQQGIYPLLTPQAIDPSHPKPVFRNQAIYLAALLSGEGLLGPERLFAVVELPQPLSRFVPLSVHGQQAFVPLEHILAARLPRLFGGYRIVAWTSFRFTRESALDTADLPRVDGLTKIEHRLRTRERGRAVRLELTTGADRRLVRRLSSMEGIRLPAAGESFEGSGIYDAADLLDMTALLEWTAIPDRDDLRYPPPASIATSRTLGRPA